MASYIIRSWPTQTQTGGLWKVMEDSCLPLRAPKPMPSVSADFSCHSVCWWLRPEKDLVVDVGSQSPEKGRESPIYLNGFSQTTKTSIFSIGVSGIFPASQVLTPQSAGITFGVPFLMAFSQARKKQFSAGQ